MASVVRHPPRYYQYTSLGTYNALLSFFYILAEEVNFDWGLLSLLSDAQGEDYGEERFANRMKKKERKEIVLIR